MVFSEREKRVYFRTVAKVKSIDLVLTKLDFRIRDSEESKMTPML